MRSDPVGHYGEVPRTCVEAARSGAGRPSEGDHEGASGQIPTTLWGRTGVRSRARVLLDRHRRAVAPVAVLAIALWAALTRASRRTRRRVARAMDGEATARLLLEAHGYEIRGEQVRGSWSLTVDGETFDFGVRADLMVARDGEVLVAEVKTGMLAPDPTFRPTRRQLPGTNWSSGRRRPGRRCRPPDDPRVAFDADRIGEEVTRRVGGACQSGSPRPGDRLVRLRGRDRAAHVEGHRHRCTARLRDLPLRDGGSGRPWRPYATKALDARARQHTRSNVHPFFYPPPFLLTMLWRTAVARDWLPRVLLINQVALALCCGPGALVRPRCSRSACAAPDANPRRHPHGTGEPPRPVVRSSVCGARPACCPLAATCKMSPALYLARWIAERRGVRSQSQSLGLPHGRGRTRNRSTAVPARALPRRAAGLRWRVPRATVPISPPANPRSPIGSIDGGGRNDHVPPRRRARERDPSLAPHWRRGLVRRTRRDALGSALFAGALMVVLLCDAGPHVRAPPRALPSARRPRCGSYAGSSDGCSLRRRLSPTQGRGRFRIRAAASQRPRGPAYSYETKFFGLLAIGALSSQAAGGRKEMTLDFTSTSSVPATWASPGSKRSVAEAGATPAGIPSSSAVFSAPSERRCARIEVGAGPAAPERSRHRALGRASRRAARRPKGTRVGPST